MRCPRARRARSSSARSGRRSEPRARRGAHRAQRPRSVSLARVDARQ
jgi:hypothetical protein